MTRIVKFLCATSVIFAGFTLVTALLAQVYWIFEYESMDGLYYLSQRQILFFLFSLSLLVFSGFLKLTEASPRLAIAAMALLITSYPVRFLDLSAWAPPSDGTGEKYIFTIDFVKPHVDIWNEQLSSLKGRPNIRALEIGSFEGSSAVWFLENILTAPSSSLTCIDIFDGPYETLFDRNLARFGSRATKIKAPSQKALRTLEGLFDFIYIDGSHVAKDVFLDVALSWDLLKPGGVIIFDDYELKPRGTEGPGWVPKIAIDAFLHVFEPYIDVLHKDYQVIVQKRREVDRNSPQITAVTKSG